MTELNEGVAEEEEILSLAALMTTDVSDVEEFEFNYDPLPESMCGFTITSAEPSTFGEGADRKYAIKVQCLIGLVDAVVDPATDVEEGGDLLGKVHDEMFFLNPHDGDKLNDAIGRVKKFASSIGVDNSGNLTEISTRLMGVDFMGKLTIYTDKQGNKRNRLSPHAIEEEGVEPTDEAAPAPAADTAAGTPAANVNIAGAITPTT